MPAPFSRKKILLVLLSALFLSLLALSILNVAFPSIQNNLGASDAELQWMIASFTVTFGVLLVPAGRLGDLLGRERIFRIGVVIFTAASLFGTFAWNPLALIITRAAMGIGSAMLTPQITGLIQHHFAGPVRARAYGYFGAVIGVAVAIGPTVGGVLITGLPEGLGWRATFGINIPVGIVVLILSYIWLPRERPERPHRLDLDPIGAILLALGVLGLIVPFTMPWTTTSWFLIVIALAPLVGWLAWEAEYARRGREPMVDIKMFRIRSFSYGTAINAIYFAGMPATWILIPQFIQQDLGGSAMVAGLVGLPGALVVTVSAPLAAKLVMRISRWVTVIGIALILLGLASAALLANLIAEEGWSIWWLPAAMTVVGFGTGMVASPNQTLAMRDIAGDRGSVAGGIVSTAQQVTIAIGVTAITGVYFHSRADNSAHGFQLAIGLILIVLLVALAVSLREIYHRRAPR